MREDWATRSGTARTWLVVDSKGESQVMEAGKQWMMRQTGVQARDLRLLDPLLSYPSTLVGREKAILINLEHIKAIITHNQLLLLNSTHPALTPFAQHLQALIIHHHHRLQTHSTNNRDGNGTVGPKVLPFEFIALEACLEAACTFLDTEATTLEQEAYPALDKLTSNITTLNLERVRQIKSRLVAITGRVQKVRDELEHLLDDDEDMAEMYLTDKMTLQRLNGSSLPLSPLNKGDGVDDDVIQPDLYKGIHLENSFEADRIPNNDGDLQNAVNGDNPLGMPNGPIKDRSGTLSSATHSVISKQLDVKELEMLLEAYFVQIDGTLNKLSTLREYVNDTEDYINIMLDDKQNHLLQMGVMLTTATLVVSVFIVVVGIFGMNITITLFRKGMPEFYWTIGGSSVASIFLYVVAIAWCKHKRLLE